MASSTLFSIITCIALLLQTSFGANPVFHFCSNSGNFTSRSHYESNLRPLIFSLRYRTPSSSGFGITSVGQYPNQIYGLALCRGDVLPFECETCISDAYKEIRSRCPNNKGATIWYDYCLLKYLDTNFFGTIDYANRFYVCNLNNVSDPVTFNYKTKELLAQLANKASVNRKLYATGELELENSNKLYGLTQCTRDLSSIDCKNCLDSAISELPNCCDGKVGGRVVGGSCNFRYEVYSFLKE